MDPDYVALYVALGAATITALAVWLLFTSALASKRRERLRARARASLDWVTTSGEFMATVTGDRFKPVPAVEPGSYSDVRRILQPSPAVTGPLVRDERQPETEVRLRQTNQMLSEELRRRPPIHPIVDHLIDFPSTAEQLVETGEFGDRDEVVAALSLNIALGQVKLDETPEGNVYVWAGPFNHPIGDR